MYSQKYSITNASKAVAEIVYKTNEVLPIYPITPASDMSAYVEEWSSKKERNIFNSVPSTFEMQSEAGVAGTMHGALQTGALSSTFTASQGLLLMLPNMYKIAGELTPNVIHVATRSIATHALSIYGDHSDIMAVRQSGYAMLGGASVQEAQDFALISQAATLRSRIPFVHFFDGFRTSHETSKIWSISEDTIQAMIDDKTIEAHRQSALNPNHPVLRGTSQGPDTYFQSREAINTFYDTCPQIVQDEMDRFAKLTGRHYKIFEYCGHPKAEQIIISMGSSTETIETTINHLNKSGHKLGLIKVRLYRPFSAEHFIKAIPSSCKAIAVLDRTKEAGSSGEPLYSDVSKSIFNAYQNKFISQLPIVVGGRYGLSSKEFTPGMVKAIIDNLNEVTPKNEFTVGITDDLTHLSLKSELLHLPVASCNAIFYHSNCKSISKSFQNTLKLLGNRTTVFVQGYTSGDYKKSNSRQLSHLRIGNQSIKAPYLIESADFIACDSIDFVINDNVLDVINSNATLLIHTTFSSDNFWKALSEDQQKKIKEKQITVYLLHDKHMSNNESLDNLHYYFLCLKNYIQKPTDSLIELSMPNSYTKETPLEEDTAFAETLLGQLLKNNGEFIPVSMFPKDGTYPTNTSVYNASNLGDLLPTWDSQLCIQCGACSMACPQSALRIKAYDISYLNSAPKTFKSIEAKEWEADSLQYSIQVNPDQCNSCNNCIEACESNALIAESVLSRLEDEKQNWNYFETIPELDRCKIDPYKVSQQQLQEPLFKYATGIEGCGQAPYLKLISQLFGERSLIANATGASSIYGGALPTTPWSKTKEGLGPAWSNSLFEDNAEFGLGYRLTLDHLQEQAKNLLEAHRSVIDNDLIDAILDNDIATDYEQTVQHKQIELLKTKLLVLNTTKADRLLSVVDSLKKKSVWIVGGDGWAYDIGYGGLDHVLSSGKNVNILVLDNEVYDNTGGQASKATPYGASTRFAHNGKVKQKKDLGALAMTYDNVYVASVAIGADQEQTLKAFNEAERFDGPSLIIAYCHSDSHGIDIKTPSKYHKAAVDSGQWLLYRNNPMRVLEGLNPLQIDSDKPKIPIMDYLKLEKRFAKFYNTNPQAELIALNTQKHINNRYNNYLRQSQQAVLVY